MTFYHQSVHLAMKTDSHVLSSDKAHTSTDNSLKNYHRLTFQKWSCVYIQRDACTQMLVDLVCPGQVFCS